MADSVGRKVANFLLFLLVNTVNCHSQRMSPEPIHRRKGFTGFINEDIGGGVGALITGIK